MNPITAIRDCYRKAFIFEGRTTRAEYWWFYGFGILMLFAVLPVFTASKSAALSAIVFAVWALATLVPGLSAAARRLHDTDRTAWWLFLSFVPLGPIVLMMWMMQPSGDANRFDTDGSALEKAPKQLKARRAAKDDPFAKLHDLARAPVVRP